MTDEELASQPGGVATRSDEEAEGAVAEHVFTPKDFRLNLETKLVWSFPTTNRCPISTAQRFAS